MNHGTGTTSTTTRRQLLRTAAVGVTAAAAATLLSSSGALAAPAPASGSKQFTYIDGILGWHWYTRGAMRDALAGWYPTWPDRVIPGAAVCGRAAGFLAEVDGAEDAGPHVSGRRRCP